MKREELIKPGDRKILVRFGKEQKELIENMKNIGMIFVECLKDLWEGSAMKPARNWG